MSDLIERLRLQEPCEDRDGCWHCMQEAADALEQAQGEIDRLRKVVQDMEEKCDYCQETDIRNQHLEAALREISEQPLSCKLDPGDCDFEGGYDCCINTARKALESAGDSGSTNTA